MYKNIGFAITGSFCNHAGVLKQIQVLKDKGFNIIPILSNSVTSTDTRFGTAKDFYDKLYEITNNKPIVSMVEAEPLGPKGLIDILVIAPCTGNTLSRLANAITDTPVVMVAKAHIRNNKPVVVGLSTNDALGFSLTNIAKLYTSKNFYFVPFGQDDPDGKPKSLIADWSKIYDTILKAEEGIQIQPSIISKPNQ